MSNPIDSTRSTHHTSEIRVTGEKTDAVDKRIIKRWIVAAVLVLAALFGVVHPDGGYITLSVILVIPILISLWAIRMEFVALRRPTITATATGLTISRRLRLDLGRTGRHPWPQVAAVEMRTHELTTTKYGAESGVTYRPLLRVHLADSNTPIEQFYPPTYRPAPPDLFAYIRAVAPDVRLDDHQQSDLDAHAARRPQHGRSR